MADPREDDRVELRWPGKYVDGVRAPLVDHGASLELVERLGPDLGPDRGPDRGPDQDPEQDPKADPNRLIRGDNLLVLEALARTAPGSVNLIYIDPPFATGNRFALARRIGDKKAGTAAQLRLPAFDDAWEGGLAGFLRMLDPRLRLMHRLLAPTGSFYLHVDPTHGHAVKLLLDEIFGPGCFQREIVWRIGWVSGFKSRARNWIRNHDLIFFYTKDPRSFTFNKSWVPHPEGYSRRAGQAAKAPGVAIDDVWNAGTSELALSGRESLDSIQIKSFSNEKTGWATQKNESLLRRIIAASSGPGDLVLDVFAGSGTTAVVAAELGRRFVICDHAEAAVQICRNRLVEAGVAFDRWELDGVERATALARVEAETGEPAERCVRDWMLTQLGAESGVEAPPGFAGRRGSVGLALGLPGERVDATQLAELAAAATRAGLDGAELLAFDWAEDETVAFAETETETDRASGPPAVVAIQAGPALFEASARTPPWVEGGVAVWERPTLVIAPPRRDLAGLTAIELRELRVQRPEHLPEALRERPGLDQIVAWSLADARAPTQPLFVGVRPGGHGALELRAELELDSEAPPTELILAWEDVCGHRHRRRVPVKGRCRSRSR